jgi:hypothetical protein
MKGNRLHYQTWLAGVRQESSGCPAQQPRAGSSSSLESLAGGIAATFYAAECTDAATEPIPATSRFTKTSTTRFARPIDLAPTRPAEGAGSGRPLGRLQGFRSAAELRRCHQRSEPKPERTFATASETVEVARAFAVCISPPSPYDPLDRKPSDIARTMAGFRGLHSSSTGTSGGGRSSNAAGRA